MKLIVLYQLLYDYNQEYKVNIGLISTLTTVRPLADGKSTTKMAGLFQMLLITAKKLNKN